MPERSQISCGSVVNLNFEGSWGKMVTKGKVVNVRMAPEAHGNIHVFETSNGIPDCIQASPTLHVMNYMDDLLVFRKPLPMGLHCQPPDVWSKITKGTAVNSH